MQAAAGDQVLTFTGLGAVQFGMTLAEAENALGTRLRSVYPDASTACWFGNRADGSDPSVSYMVKNDRVVRIDVEDHAWPDSKVLTPHVITARGIRVGSSVNDVKIAYGPELSIDKDADHVTLKVLSADKGHGLAFDAQDGKVVALQAGLADIYYVDDAPCE